MKQFLRLLLAAGIIAFAASITAGSCDKAADPNNNANTNTNANDGSGGDGGTGGSGGSGGSGGGDGSGGGGGSVIKYNPPTPIADAGSIKIININAAIAKVNNTTQTILIKASELKQTFGRDNVAFSTGLYGGHLFKVFDITNEKAKEGLVLVGKGNVASADKITTSAPVTTYPTGATGNDGIHVLHATADHAAGRVFSGLNFISVFANKTLPTDSLKNTEPFAFSKQAVATPHLGTFQVKPFFFCGSAASLATASTIAATDKLTGGHKASCYMGVWGFHLGGTVMRDPWFAAGAPFKREIEVAIAAIRTDDWTIGDLLSDGTAAANISAFNDGISAAEMKRITDSNSNPVPFKKYSIKVVRDADF